MVSWTFIIIIRRLFSVSLSSPPSQSDSYESFLLSVPRLFDSHCGEVFVLIPNKKYLKATASPPVFYWAYYFWGLQHSTRTVTKISISTAKLLGRVVYLIMENGNHNSHRNLINRSPPPAWVPEMLSSTRDWDLKWERERESGWKLSSQWSVTNKGLAFGSHLYT